MRLILLVLLAVAASPTAAMEWRDENGMVRIETADGGLIIQSEDMRDPMHCQITEWPPKGYITHYVCEDGFRIELEVIDLETVKMNGILMHLTEA